MELLRTTLHKYQDGKRLDAFAEEKDVLAQIQAQERHLLTRRHELQAINMNRELRGLDRIEKRERQSHETSLTRQGRVSARGGDARGPNLTLELKPKGRRAVPHKAMNRYRNRLGEAMGRAASNPDETFAAAARLMPS